MPVPSARSVLGVPPTATPAEVRRAFRRRAHELHPDRNPSPHAAADFRALRAAYETLLAGGPADTFDVEQIARDIEEAAREADRRRGSGGESTQAWQQVRVPLDRTARERVADGLATPRGRVGLGAGLVLAVALGFGLQAVLRRTDFGLGILAAAQDPAAVRLVGVPLSRISLTIWGAGAALAAIAALLVEPTVGILYPGYASELYVVGLAAAVIGGLN
ncbi:MAG TPA: DnaJ domain-containing protein, partial [Rubricoccaceae bacterium]